MDALKLFQAWCQSECNGRWERGYGAQIHMLADKPGWTVRIELDGTSLTGKRFKELRRADREMDWIHCRVHESKFEGLGGPYMLEEILKVFLTWARQAGAT
jgi:hypothetical protein